MRTIDHFLWLRNWIVNVRRPIYNLFLGVDIPRNSSVSLSATFRSTSRGSITVGEETLIAFKTLLLGYDVSSGREEPIRVGKYCFIGGGSIIMPGVTIGDGSIVGAGSVVYDDVPSGCIVAGNPAKVIKTDIIVSKKGRLQGADERALAVKTALQAEIGADVPKFSRETP